MLTGSVLHPQILGALAAAGHGSQVLIADANFPASTSRGPNAVLVHLNLAPGVVDAVTICAALTRVVPIEYAAVMAVLPQFPEVPGGSGAEPPPAVWGEFTRVLSGTGCPGLDQIERHAFYARVATPQTALVVVSGDTRLYGNLLLRVGVCRTPPGDAERSG